MFGPSVLLLQRRLILMEPTFPSWPFWIFITLILTEKYSGKPYPERSQCTLLQEAVFTPLAGCGAYHQEVSPFLWVASTEWPRLQGGCISGRLRPTHLVAQVDDSKTMGYVLTGRLLFWSCSCAEIDRNNWCVQGGEAIHEVLESEMGFCFSRFPTKTLIGLGIIQRPCIMPTHGWGYSIYNLFIAAWPMIWYDMIIYDMIEFDMTYTVHDRYDMIWYDIQIYTVLLCDTVTLVVFFSISCWGRW